MEPGSQIWCITCFQINKYFKLISSVTTFRFDHHSTIPSFEASQAGQASFIV